MKTINDINKYIVQQVRDGRINGQDAYEILNIINNQKNGAKSTEEIAVIGLACKFPGADNYNEYKRNLMENKCFIGSFPRSRRIDTDPLINNTDGEEAYFKGGFLREINKFDPAFFRILPIEANLMDPYQRMLLEVSYECMEDAGYGGDALKGSRTGVYIGADHSFRSILPSYSQVIKEHDMLSMTGSWTGILSSRISYCFNLNGPSVVVDTACSSGLVAVHHAIRGIMNNDCSMAIAGGISLMLLPLKNNFFQAVVSTETHINSFDKKAMGTLWGEGIGLLMLKPLSKALLDGDSIYAVIKASAINNDGSSNGITAPDSKAQENVVVRAWEDAGVNPEDISFIEAHGTGTILGDPIEIDAIKKAFGRYTAKKQFCGIGTVKTNISHTVAASGIAGIIKIIAAFESESIPASLNFTEPNPYIDFADSPVYVADKNIEWEKSNSARIAGISAFGLSGTNCHMVLEEPPGRVLPDEAAEVNVFAVSAKTKESLLELLNRYWLFLKGKEGMNISDLCYTLNKGRGHYNYRLFIIVNSIRDLYGKIDNIKNNLNIDGIKDCYFGYHKVVSKKKQNLKTGEVQEKDVVSYTSKANRFVMEYVENGRSHDLEKIADLYIKGARIDWDVLYSRQKRNRVHAPVYAFMREICWLTPKQPVSADDSPVMYKTKFIEAGMNKSGREHARNILFIHKNQPESKELINMICRDNENNVLAVYYKDDLNYSIFSDTPGADEDEKDLDVIFYMYDSNCNEIVDSGQLDNMVEDIIGNIYSKVKKLLNEGFKRKIRVMFAVNNAFGINGENPANPEYALLSGFARTLMLENAGIYCKCLYLDNAGDSRRIAEELLSTDGGFNVAYKDGRRYVEKLLEYDISKAGRSIKIRDGGVYIILGGTGKLGIRTALYLAEKRNVRLVLINRSKLPSAESWEGIVKKNEEKELISKIKGLKALQELGAEVYCYNCDISDREQFGQTIEKIRNKFHCINGIVHCSGSVIMNFIVNKSWKEFKTVISSKVKGTFHINELFNDGELDFCILYSSVSSLTGFPGLADYSAANSYLEAFAEKYDNRTKFFAVSWPAWNNIGMAEDYPKSFEGIFESLNEDEALRLLDCILNKGTGNIIPGRLNYSNLDLFNNYKKTFDIDEKIKIRFEDNKDRPGWPSNTLNVRLKGNGNTQYAGLQNRLAYIWGNVLGMEEIDIYENFNDLGGDSIMGARLLKELEKEFPFTIGLTDLFSYPSIAQMAEYIGSKEHTLKNHGKKSTEMHAEKGYGLKEQIKGFSNDEISIDDILELLDKVRETNDE